MLGPRHPPSPIVWHGEVLDAAEVERYIREHLRARFDDLVAELNGGATHYDCLNGAQVVLKMSVHLDFTWIKVEKADTPREI